MDINKLQEKISKISTAKGFDDELLEQKFMLLTEEVGEFAKSVRKAVGMRIGNHSNKREMGEEAADVLYVLLDICNKMGLDMDMEFEAKLKVIKKRKYK